MDMTYMRERSYRITNLLRQQNQREQRLLERRIWSKQGINAIYRHEMELVTREQQRIRQDLNQIRKTATTTWGMLPPRGNAEPGSNPDDASQMSLNKRKELEMILYGSGRKQKGKRKASKQMSLDTDSVGTSNLDSAKERDDEVISTESITVTLSGSPTKHSPPESLSKDEKLPDAIATPRIQGASRERSFGSLDMLQAKDNVAKRLTAPPSSTTTATTTATTITGDSNSTMGQPTPKRQKKPLVKSSVRSSDSSLSPSKTTKALTPIDEQTFNEEEEQQQESQTARKQNNQSKVTFADHQTMLTNQNAETNDNNPSTQKGGKKPLKRRDSDVGQKVEFDQSKYNPDGSLRMLHRMPDMDSRYKEARKARYIRHKDRQHLEKELAVHEMFDPKTSAKGKGRRGQTT